MDEILNKTRIKSTSGIEDNLNRYNIEYGFFDDSMKNQIFGFCECFYDTDSHLHMFGFDKISDSLVIKKLSFYEKFIGKGYYRDFYSQIENFAKENLSASGIEFHMIVNNKLQKILKKDGFILDSSGYFAYKPLTLETLF